MDPGFPVIQHFPTSIHKQIVQMSRSPARVQHPNHIIHLGIIAQGIHAQQAFQIKSSALV
jgi:hypothetical protein